MQNLDDELCYYETDKEICKDVLDLNISFEEKQAYLQKSKEITKFIQAITEKINDLDSEKDLILSEHPIIAHYALKGNDDEDDSNDSEKEKNEDPY